MSAHHPIFQKDDFLQTLQWLKRKVNRSIADRIERTIKEKIALDPLRGTGRIQADSMKPMRYLRIGKRRLYFIYCKECRDEGYRERWNCPNCEELSDNSVLILDIDKRENAYPW